MTRRAPLAQGRTIPLPTGDIGLGVTTALAATRAPYTSAARERVVAGVAGGVVYISLLKECDAILAG